MVNGGRGFRKSPGREDEQHNPTRSATTGGLRSLDELGIVLVRRGGGGFGGGRWGVRIAFAPDPEEVREDAEQHGNRAPGGRGDQIMDANQGQGVGYREPNREAAGPGKMELPKPLPRGPLILEDPGIVDEEADEERHLRRRDGGG